MQTDRGDGAGSIGSLSLHDHEAVEEIPASTDTIPSTTAASTSPSTSVPVSPPVG